MPLYEVPVTATIDAANDADAEKKKMEIERLLPVVKMTLASKGVKSVVIGKPKVKA